VEKPRGGTVRAARRRIVGDRERLSPPAAIVAGRQGEAATAAATAARRIPARLRFRTSDGGYRVPRQLKDRNAESTVTPVAVERGNHWACLHAWGESGTDAR